jgi:putative ABC transport system substrate-binding protein
LVKSLSHPGGNITGVTPLNADLDAKRLQILTELVPTETVALLVNPANPIADALPHELEGVARSMHRQLRVVRASSDRELEQAFATLAEIKAGALAIGADTFFNGRVVQLAALALRHNLPAVYASRQFAMAGGLASYGASITDGFRTAGLYAGRILKGENPAALPVQQATRIELVINLKTARALGITIPLVLSGRADEVID